MLYIAIGMLGATVMPHNLYLHSSIVQSRNYKRTPDGKREAIFMANVDSALALTVALVCECGHCGGGGSGVLSQRPL